MYKKIAAFILKATSLTLSTILLVVMSLIFIGLIGQLAGLIDIKQMMLKIDLWSIENSQAIVPVLLNVFYVLFTLVGVAWVIGILEAVKVLKKRICKHLKMLSLLEKVIEEGIWIKRNTVDPVKSEELIHIMLTSENEVTVSRLSAKRQLNAVTTYGVDIEPKFKEQKIYVGK